MEVLSFEINQVTSLFLVSVPGDYLEEPITGAPGKIKER